MKESHLAKGEFFQESLGFVGITKDKIIRDLDLGPRELSRDQSLIGSEIFRVCVESLQEIEVILNLSWFRLDYSSV